MSNLNRSAFQGHPFHLVSPSPWPIFTCISLLTLTTSGVLTMHGFSNAGFWLACALILVMSSMFFWFRDVVSEGTYLGNHTLAVQRGLNMGVALFIVSEGLFFLAIFWAYFHSALSPTVELGAQWPPMGIEAINAFELPLLNTVLLLASGVTVTYAHHSLIQGNRNGALYGTMFTIVLALVFTAFQGVEYSVSSFTLSDGAFGSCFYFGTGLTVAPINNIKTNTISTTNKLSPYWITGFSDAEGSFSVKIGKDLKRKHGIRVIPVFTIELHKKDIELLKSIKSFFGVGNITERIRSGRPSAIYTVQGLKDLKNIVIPHFREYALLTQKKADFLLFCSVVDLMISNKSLSRNNIIEVLCIKSSMNTGLSNILKELFPEVKNIKPVERPVITSQRIESEKWLLGFIEGEGNFYIRSSITQVALAFSISQHSRDGHLMGVIRNYFSCGKLERPSTRPNIVNFVVYKHEDILNRIVSFFTLNPIIGIKRLDFNDFCKVSSLMKNNIHLTKEGGEKIMFIKKNMNTGRKL